MKWYPLIIAAFVLLATSASANEKLPLSNGDAPDYRQKWAIIVGINDYSQGRGLRDLRYAANDARAFRQLLVDEFGYDDDHVLYLTTDADEARRTHSSNAGPMRSIVDGRPTQEELLNAFKVWLKTKQVHEDDCVLVFFAGHGLRDQATGAGFLAAADSTNEDKNNTCISIDWIREQLLHKKIAKCRHKLVLLDCCFSGTLFSNSGAGLFNHPVSAAPVQQRRVGGEIEFYLSGGAFFGMTAGLGDQPVTDVWADSEHSLFTKEILRAMSERTNSESEDHVFTFTRLVGTVRPRVAAAVIEQNALSNQIPIAGRLEPGDGEFLFRQSKDTHVPWELSKNDYEAGILATQARGIADADPQGKVITKREFEVLSLIAHASDAVKERLLRQITSSESEQAPILSEKLHSRAARISHAITLADEARRQRLVENMLANAALQPENPWIKTSIAEIGAVLDDPSSPDFDGMMTSIIPDVLETTQDAGVITRLCKALAPRAHLLSERQLDFLATHACRLQRISASNVEAFKPIIAAMNRSQAKRFNSTILKEIDEIASKARMRTDELSHKLALSHEQLAPFSRAPELLSYDKTPSDFLKVHLEVVTILVQSGSDSTANEVLNRLVQSDLSKSHAAEARAALITLLGYRYINADSARNILIALVDLDSQPEDFVNVHALISKRLQSEEQNPPFKRPVAARVRSPEVTYRAELGIHQATIKELTRILDAFRHLSNEGKAARFKSILRINVARDASSTARSSATGVKDPLARLSGSGLLQTCVQMVSRGMNDEDGKLLEKHCQRLSTAHKNELASKFAVETVNHGLTPSMSYAFRHLTKYLTEEEKEEVLGEIMSALRPEEAIGYARMDSFLKEANRYFSFDDWQTELFFEYRSNARSTIWGEFAEQTRIIAEATDGKRSDATKKIPEIVARQLSERDSSSMRDPSCRELIALGQAALAFKSDLTPEVASDIAREIILAVQESSEGYETGGEFEIEFATLLANFVKHMKPSAVRSMLQSTVCLGIVREHVVAAANDHLGTDLDVWALVNRLKESTPVDLWMIEPPKPTAIRMQ